MKTVLQRIELLEQKIERLEKEVYGYYTDEIDARLDADGELYHHLAESAINNGEFDYETHYDAIY